MFTNLKVVNILFTYVGYIKTSKAFNEAGFLKTRNLARFAEWKGPKGSFFSSNKAEITLTKTKAKEK